jgi:hypothetical protein
MTIIDVVSQQADSRPDMTLVDYVEVGLPAWRVLARCDVLEPKAISAIDETTMRAISLGVDDPLDLQILLGLDEQVLDSTLTGLVDHEWARDAGGDGKIGLTDAGDEILTAAVEIVARELVVPFDYDGLLRRPILDQNLVDRRIGAARGLREVPATPERPPDVTELRACRQSIGRVLRVAGGRREQDAQLLDVRSIDRRDRYMLPALAMVFAPRGRGRCEVALAVDDEISIEHEAAFVNAGLADRIGLDRRLRATRRRALTSPGPRGRAAALHEDAEREARRRLREAREHAANASAETPGQEDDDVRQARARLNDLSTRTVLPHEHAALLRVALSASRERLLIAGGAVSSAHVDGRFLRQLRRILEAGALVRIIVSGAAPGSEAALKSLHDAARDYPKLIVEEHDLGAAGALISDSRFVVFGAFPWLGQLGDRDRPLVDTRSLLTRDPEAINEEWVRLDSRTRGDHDRVPGPKRRRRRRRGGPRGEGHRQAP